MSPVSRQLKLTAEQRQAVEETIAATVAVNVYRQLQTIPGVDEVSSGGNIAGNCCSCSKAEEMA